MPPDLAGHPIHDAMMLNQPISWVLAALALSASWGCGPTERHVAIHARTANGQPLADLEVAVLPYNPTRLLDSLTLAAPTTRPGFPELEQQFESYRPPALETLRAEDAEWQATRDTVEALADSLNAADRGSSGYARAYQRFGELYRRFTQRTAARDARLREQLGEHRDLASRAMSAADSLRAWELMAFRDYSVLAESAVVRSGRVIHETSTGDDGIAYVTLKRGRWWVTARWRDPENPYREYTWNTAMVVGRFGPRRVPLLLETATSRWRH